MLSVSVSHHGLCGGDEVIVNRGLQGINVLLKLFFIVPAIRTGEVKKRVAVIEQGSRCSNLICIVIDHKTEITIVAVSVADDGIKDNQINQLIVIGLTEIFIILNNCGEAARGDYTANGNERIFLAGEQITGGAEDAFPLSEIIADVIQTHELSDLSSVKLRIGFKAGVGSTRSSALIELNRILDATPALGKHTGGGELRTGMKRSTTAASKAGKGDIGKDGVELVVVEIVLVEGAGEVLRYDPETVVQRQALADRNDVKRTIDAQTALGEERIYKGAVARNGAVLQPLGKACTIQFQIQRQQ